MTSGSNNSIIYFWKYYAAIVKESVVYMKWIGIFKWRPSSSLRSREKLKSLPSTMFLHLKKTNKKIKYG